MWLEKKIVFYGYPASQICDLIVALSALMPHYLFSLSPHSIRTEKEIKEAQNFALPLQIFEYTHLAPSVSLVSIDKLNEKKSYLIGSTNRLFAEGAVAADVIVYSQGNIKWIDTKLENSLKLFQRDKMFIDNIIAKVKECETLGDEQFIGSDLWIRTRFAKYTLSLLSVIVHSNFGVDGSVSSVYNPNWVSLWKNTANFQKMEKKV